MTPPTPRHWAISHRARKAHDRLNRALVNAAAQGVRPRCGDFETSHLWLSEHTQERAMAALMCADCVVLDECADVGEFQSFGIWGGVDRTKRQQREAA
jgi:hypothetical protein